MTFFRTAAIAATLGAAGTPLAASAHDGPHAADHAPIGVMADHRHGKGEVMLSYRFMRMVMEGNRIGTDGISPDSIATSIPNRFAARPTQPPTLRVVPLEMTMDMHMVGGMIGLTDRVTLMAMGSYLTKDMDHVTYRGGIGRERLGNFTTEVSGFGDTNLTAIIGIDNGARPERQVNLNLGVSAPTGSIKETDEVLTPMGMRPEMRLPYPMQLGSGTWDLRPGLTYRDRRQKLSWGSQISGVFRLDNNAEGYALGDRGEATAWVGYSPVPAVTTSLRLKASSQRQIEGIDPRIVAPVQTADPRNLGGEEVEILAGINFAGQSGALRGHRFAAEIGLPAYRDLNGPQLETDLSFTLGWQKAF